MVNLGNIDVMGHITKIAVVANATAIWEYDSSQADNCVLGGSLDVISAIHTLAIKISIVLSNFSHGSPLIHNRFKRLASASNTFIAPNSVAVSLKL